MKSTTRKNFLLCLALSALGMASASAQSNTVPAGYFTLNIAAGTVGSPTISVLSLPLQDTATASGQMVGVITAVTPSTISNSTGGWTAGQLAVQATPYLIEITSGAAAGRTFLLANTVVSPTLGNTATTVNLDPTDASLVDLTNLGIVTGTDTYQIIPADTISSVFGTPASSGVVGGAAASDADQIQIFNTAAGVWQNYYYSTSANPPGWVKTGIPAAGGNIAIRPDSGVLYTRRGPALNLIMTGRVPSVARQTGVSNAGITFLSNDWPTDFTLAASNIQNTPGWVKGAQSSADTVQVYAPGNVWLTYYHNGTSWMRTGIIPVNGDAFVIPAGSALVVTKKVTSAGQSILTQPLPYSLN